MRPEASSLLEPPHALAELLLCQCFDLVLVEVVFADDLQDQALLIFGAVPTVLFCCRRGS